MIQDAKGHKMAFVDGAGQLSRCQNEQKDGAYGKDGKTYMDASGDLMFTIKNNPDKTCDILMLRAKNRECA